jgi:hypothetical protein
MEWTMSTIRRSSRSERIDRDASSSAELLAGSNATREQNAGVGTYFPALPPPPKRWVSHRKAEIVAAIRNGYLTLDDALNRYSLTVDEYMTWRHGLDIFGLAGLRVNEIQRRRRIQMRPKDNSQEASDGAG